MQHKKLKSEFNDVKSANKRLTSAVKAAAEGNNILKATLEKIHGTLDDSIAENKLVNISKKNHRRWKYLMQINIQAEIESQQAAGKI